MTVSAGSHAYVQETGLLKQLGSAIQQLAVEAHRLLEFGPRILNITHTQTTVYKNARFQYKSITT